MSFSCPSGHSSDESDYCSVCGAAIAGGGAILSGTTPATLPRMAAALVQAGTAAGACPVCGEPRSSDARFCEVCRYDFVEKKAGPPPAAIPAVRWRLVVTIDPSLDTDPDPAVQPPSDPPRIFPVEQNELLVGRRDDRQQIRPVVPLHDPGASRRHAKVIRNADGSVALHDLGSTNGTKVNGEDVASGAVRALSEGDEITLGRWTRVRLEAVK